MPTKKAVAINYEREQKEGVPRIVAVGEGHVAERILSLAREHDVPIVEDLELVNKMVRFPPGTQIPPELFEAVAKVLAFVYKLEKGYPR